MAAIVETFPRGFRFSDSVPPGNRSALMVMFSFTPVDSANPLARTLANRIFSEPENQDDIYLFSHVPLVGKSLVYQRDGEGLDYHANFHLHLTTVDAQRTRVEVVVIDPWIPCGRVFNVHAGSGYVDSIAKVKPTTIEEYQILLRLGATLKEADMPSLRVPAPSAPTTVRIYP